jgi:hypothetical protein
LKHYRPDQWEHYPHLFALGSYSAEGVEHLFKEFYEWWKSNNFQEIRTFNFNRDRDFSGSEEDKYLLVVRLQNKTTVSQKQR